MAKIKLKNVKQVKKSPANPAPKIVKKLKKSKTNLSKSKPKSDSESNPLAEIQTIFQPFSKDQLINLVTDLCVSHDSLYALIESAADKDVSHRKLFVFGLGWDANRLSVESVFGQFGEITDLNVVMDRATGKCKGYAFITFQTRKSAQKVLKNPKVQVGTRMTTCQLASAGPAPLAAPGVVSHQHFSSDFPQRKIYVNNVPVNANAERLRSFFEQFGEIENGPTGLDPATGKFRGYALFVFKTVEGAKKVLEEPYKIFEGNQVHCQKAAEGKGKGIGGTASITTAIQQVQPQMLETVSAAQQAQAQAQAQAQSMAFFGQPMGLMNSLYGAGLYGNANLGALMGGYYGMMGGQMQGLGLGSYGVSGIGAYTGGGMTVGGVNGEMMPVPPQTSSSLAKTSRKDDVDYFSNL